jgi:transcriptional regulator with PAS, ATPase and Fis domain
MLDGTYTVFVMVSAEDDMTHGDNIYEKTDWEITLTVPDVDYRVTSISNTSLNMQIKLLRVLQDQEVYMVGSKKPQQVDVRVIAATNVDLLELVNKSKFREDLFYRLNVFRFKLPDLSARRADLPLLIRHILRRLSATRANRRIGIAEAAMEILLNFDYPGNVRELENIIEHALIICQGNTIERRHLPLALQKDSAPPEIAHREAGDLEDEVEFSERKRIQATLKKYNWSRSKTAQALNINRTTLWRKMKKYNISV